jgi:hypothetical protein
MIKSMGLLQRRLDLDADGFRDHYENKHAPMAEELLGFAGYQRNYPESRSAREALGLDGLSEFWFENPGETARIGQLMQGEIGAQFIEDELRFMNTQENATYGVAERLFGARPAPGDAIRAVAITRLPAGARAGQRDRRLDFEDRRSRERRLAGVLAALYSVPIGASMRLPAGRPGVGCIESLWLSDREALGRCNHWRAAAGAVALSVVHEAGRPVLEPLG